MTEIRRVRKLNRIKYLKKELKKHKIELLFHTETVPLSDKEIRFREYFCDYILKYQREKYV